LALFLQPQNESGLLGLASELQNGSMARHEPISPERWCSFMRSFSSPAIKQTHFSDPTKSRLNKERQQKKPNKTNITDEKMHRAKPLHQRSYLRRIKGGHQNCRVGSMARANQPQKMVCFGCIFHHSPAS